MTHRAGARRAAFAGDRLVAALARASWAPRGLAHATARWIVRGDDACLDRLAEAAIEAGDADIAAFLRWTSSVFSSSALRRIANRLAAALRQRDAARLLRIAQLVRDDRGEIDPVLGAVILFHEVRHLHQLRAARSGLDAVLRLRSGAYDRAMSPALKGDLALYEARLRHRLDDLDGARAALGGAELTPGQDAAARDLDAVMTCPADPEGALAILEKRFAVHGANAKESATLYAALLERMDRGAEAEAFLEAWRSDPGRSPMEAAEALPGLANIALARDCDAAKNLLRAYWTAFGLDMAFGPGPVSIETLAPPPPPLAATQPDFSEARVSVVMTTYRSAAHVGPAIASILAQSWRDLELLVVDDASDDDTCDRIEAIARSDPRVRLIRRDCNAGTYVAKNAGIAEARGAFVALCDSDDWWHPLHLERHLAVMLDRPALRFTSSAWVRMDETGRIALKPNGGYLHFNPASTLFRAEVFREIGFFDAVRVGADTEFVWRLRQAYGRDAEVELREPLAVGRLRSGSLTQSGPGAYNANNFSPLRLSYWESWSAWHRRCALEGRTPHLPRRAPTDVADRAFPAPEEILP